MTLPKRSPILPADLVGVPNGNLPAGTLVEIGPSGFVHPLTARAWRALVAAAGQVGLPLTYTYGGTYRSYKAQEALFKSRYAPGGTFGDCKHWNGALWCKTGNYATAAVPGTSNHGLGLAIDCAFDRDPVDGLGPEDAAAINAHPQWPWLVGNANRFGFWWSLDSEPWHIQYVTAEAVPAAVLAFEGQQPLPLPPPVIPDTPSEVEMPFIAYWTGIPGLCFYGALGWRWAKDQAEIDLNVFLGLARYGPGGQPLELDPATMKAPEIR